MEAGIVRDGDALFDPNPLGSVHQLDYPRKAYHAGQTGYEI
jgi:hypothetical protein